MVPFGLFGHFGLRICFGLRASDFGFGGLGASASKPAPRVEIAFAPRSLHSAALLNTSLDTLRILSDPTRLRLLALLSREELSVAELQEILGMAQSRISSQLAQLRQAGLVADRREGKKAFYSLRTGLPARPQTLLKAAVDSTADTSGFAEDRTNLDRILQKRRRVAEQ